MRSALKVYFVSLWMPTVTAVFFLGAWLGSVILRGAWVSNVLLILLLLSLAGVLASSIHQFAVYSWKKGLVSLVLSAGTSSGAVAVLTFVALATAFGGPAEDGFGKNIVIPPDMIVEEPRKDRLPEEERAGDAEGKELVGVYAAQKATAQPKAVSTALDVLNSFAGDGRSVLLRHLASSAKWFVTEERGKIYARRRFVTSDGRWATSLNGYYTNHDFDGFAGQYFQCRIVIGIDGPVLDRPWRGRSTQATVGPGQVNVKTRKSTNPGFESYLVLRSKGPALEVFEEAETQSRPFTALALAKIKDELTALSKSGAVKKAGFDPALLPPESMKKGPPEMYLVKGMQGGIYQVYAYVDPGEAGRVYLKVFEATKNTPLSTRRVRERSTEYIGWSDDPKELFFYNTEITVYEGDWGVYYPARFELWFRPASGKPERKLLEKIFKIEGWQR